MYTSLSVVLFSSFAENDRDNVSATTSCFPGVCSSVKSYFCMRNNSRCNLGGASHSLVIEDMQTPTNVTELQRVLGLVTFLGRYIPNLSARTAPLRQLLEKDIDWQWHSEQESAWNGMTKAKR